MKHKARALTMLFAIFAFAVLQAFEPGDVIEDKCSTQEDMQADCGGFKAEGAGQAKNVIFLIGDGMGIGQTYAGRVYINGPDQPLAWEKLPFKGLVTTCSIGGITDSAAAGTALATGHKTTNGAISAKMFPSYEVFPSILEQVHDRKAAGIVSTTSIWDATPAVFVSHARVRSQAREIARQMIEVSKPEVIMGGGAAAFLPKKLALDPADKEDLTAKAGQSGWTVINTESELKALDTESVSRVLGLFAEDSMDYEVDRKADSTEPHLSDMARAAIAVLDNDQRGFFLMIEGARIDHAGHAMSMDKVIGEMVEFDKTVKLVLEWAKTHPDTLVLITADHETGGIRVHPGKYQRGDKIEVDWTTKDFLSHASHSSQRVPIHGIGPNAGAIREHMDNTEVYCIIRNAFEK